MTHCCEDISPLRHGFQVLGLLGAQDPSLRFVNQKNSESQFVTNTKSKVVAFRCFVYELNVIWDNSIELVNSIIPGKGSPDHQ